MEQALAFLSAADPVLARLIKQAGPCTLQKNSEPFQKLVKAIVSQQISTKAADSVYNKLLLLLRGLLEPDALLALSTEELRSAGLSGQKVGYLLNLSEHFLAKPEFYENLDTHTDAEICTELVSIKGIGIWSAQMFLMFNLGRLNILPTDDLGLKKGMQLAYSLPDVPDKKTMEAVAANWEPYKSVGTWYMWRALEQNKKK